MSVNAPLVTLFCVLGITAYLLIPRLIIRPQFEARLRHLRDEVYDAQFRGERLPFDHPDVLALLLQIRRSADASRNISLFKHLVSLASATRRFSSSSIASESDMAPSGPQALRALAPNYELSGMDSEQRQLFESYQRRLFYTETKMLLFSTWPSIVLSLPCLVAMVLGFPLIGDAAYDRHRLSIEKQTQAVATQESHFEVRSTTRSRTSHGDVRKEERATEGEGVSPEPIQVLGGLIVEVALPNRDRVESFEFHCANCNNTWTVTYQVREVDGMSHYFYMTGIPASPPSTGRLCPNCWQPATERLMVQSTDSPLTLAER